MFCSGCGEYVSSHRTCGVNCGVRKNHCRLIPKLSQDLRYGLGLWSNEFFKLYFRTRMKSQFTLESSDVKAILAAAEAHAIQNNWAVSIAIVDNGGHLLGMLRLDGAAPLSSHICQAKAHTSAMGKRESKVYEDIINGGRQSFLSAPFVAGMLEGGVPIMKDGQCLGAVGVSGVKSFEDAEVAKAGIAAIGL